jgi:DNA replication and repair protein RecF
MIDDLPSELDAQHQNLVINALFDLKQQILITAIDPDSLDLSLWTDSRMFHVKHGRFSEVV